MVGLSFTALNPTEDHFLEYRKEGYSNTALSEGINSTRGVMCEAILKSLTNIPEDEELISVLKHLAEDDTLSVRASLVYYLPLGLKPLGWGICFDLEDRALGVLDKLIELRWPGVEEFLKDTERLELYH